MVKRRPVTEYALYRGRYMIGYCLALLIIVALIVFAAFYVPGGLRDAERATAVASTSLEFQEFNPEAVLGLPYNLLQRLSFAVFGITTLSVKLPSMILGVITVIGIFYLLKEWFRKNVAMIATVIGATIPLFVFMAQDGTPTIYAIAVAVWLLVAATRVSRRHEPRLLWKVILFILLALNLYAPLGIYLNLAILTTVIFHPHIRYLVRRLNLNYIAIASVTSLLLLAPLLYSLTIKPEIGLQLLGLPDQVPNVTENLKTILLNYSGAVPISSPILHPVFSIGIVLLMLVGAYRFLVVKYTARSYIIWFWILTLAPLLVINPEHLPYVLPLAITMVAMGIASLIAEWYKLFPHNPYARVIGLLPLSIIVIGIVSSDTSRYLVGYHYSPEITSHFNRDLELLDQTLTHAKASTEQPMQLVVGEKRVKFYEAVANYDGRFHVANDINDVQKPYILTNLAKSSRGSQSIPAFVATDAKSTQADRFYLYTDEQK